VLKLLPILVDSPDIASTAAKADQSRNQGIFNQSCPESSRKSPFKQSLTLLIASSPGTQFVTNAFIG